MHLDFSFFLTQMSGIYKLSDRLVSVRLTGLPPVKTDTIIHHPRTSADKERLEVGLNNIYMSPMESRECTLLMVLCKLTSNA